MPPAGVMDSRRALVLSSETVRIQQLFIPVSYTDTREETVGGRCSYQQTFYLTLKERVARHDRRPNSFGENPGPTVRGEVKKIRIDREGNLPDVGV